MATAKKRTSKKNGNNSSKALAQAQPPDQGEAKLSDTERAYALKQLGEIQSKRLALSQMVEQFSSIEQQYMIKKAQLLQEIQELNASQREWLKRTAEAHGINTDETGVSWNLSPDTWTFNRMG